MPHLYLVRHAEPNIDPAQPFDSWPLTASGRVAARRIAEELPRVDRVIASPEVKALETAQALAGEWDVAVEIDDRLCEVGGRRWVESSARYREQVRSYFAGDEPGGWERADAATARIVSATEEVMSRAEDAVVVSHGLILTLLRSWFDGVQPAMLVTVWESMRFPDVCTLDWDARRVLSEFGSDEPT